MDRIFKSKEHIVASEDFIVESVKLTTFSDNALYNPFRDRKISSKTKMLEVVTHTKINKRTFKREYDYDLRTVSESRRMNIFRGRTKITDGLIAGTFLNTIIYGDMDSFLSDWEDFLQDHKKSLVPANIGKVFDMIASIQPQVKNAITRPENILAKANEAVLAIWEYDLKNSKYNFCQSPAKYELSKNRHLFNLFKEAVGRHGQPLARYLTIKNTWSIGDGFFAMCWCIMTGVHPQRLLNFVGYYLTSPSNNPEEFVADNPEAQEYEIPIYSEDRKRIVGYKLANPKFTTGFIHEFSRMIQDVEFLGDNPIDDDFISLTLKFNLEDFISPDTLKWRPVPLTEKDKEYYRSMGVNNNNDSTRAEINRKLYRVGCSEEDNKKLAAVGNPLYDISIKGSE